MFTVNRLSMAIAGPVFYAVIATLIFFTFSFGLEAAHTHPGHSHSAEPQVQSHSTIYGETKRLGNGTVRTFVKLDSNGVPSDVGVAFSEAALTGLPQESDRFGEEYPLKLTLRDGIGYSTFEYELPFPKEASAPPFTHVALNWNPEGHGSGAFAAPHFDIHFSVMSPEKRHAITSDDDFFKKCYKPLPAEFVAEGYVTPALAAEPRMGVHWVDTTGPEFSGEAWTKSFLYGSYDGEMVFLEPMITKAFLDTKPNTTDAIKQPSAYPKSGYYPTTYSVNYANGEYSVSLNELTFHSSRFSQLAFVPKSTSFATSRSSRLLTK